MRLVVKLSTLLVLLVGALSVEEEERLIGWRGETYRAPPASSPPPPCVDTHSSCPDWAAGGECSKNPLFMAPACARACDLCQDTLAASRAPPRDVGTVAIATRGGSMMQMPRIGFGTAGLGCALTPRAVKEALLAGYRHLDTAQASEWYCEQGVGQALQDSKVPRSEVFITTKQHPRHFSRESTLEMFESSLSNLGTDYIDLMLLHYPKCWGNLCQGHQDPGPDAWQEAWRTLEEIWGQGRLKAIGVSNFSPREVEDLLQWAHVRPTVVQSHSDPLQSNKELREVCEREGLVFTAYSSLGTQHAMRTGGRNPVLTHPVIQQIGTEVGKSPAQVVLKWALSHNQVVIPRSRSREHMDQNLNLNFELSSKQLRDIDSLDGTRI